MLVPLPIIFNTKIIPKIRKRLKEKLIFNKMIYYYFLPKTLQPICWWVDVAFYIFIKIMKIKMRDKNFCALYPVNYDVNQSTRFEIIMSFIAVAIAIMFVLGLALSAFFHYVYHCPE